MNALLAKIGQLAIFLICAQTLIHFRPKNSYEKYIKLLVSMMLLILLVEPIMGLLGKGNDEVFLDRINVYEEQLQGILANPELESGEIEQILQNITQQKVNEGLVQVQEVQSVEQSQEQAVSGNTVEMRFEEQETEEKAEKESVEKIEIQVQVEKIKEIEMGAEDGSFTENH